jgi:hypothetical protein
VTAVYGLLGSEWSIWGQHPNFDTIPYQSGLVGVDTLLRFRYPEPRA